MMPRAEVFADAGPSIGLGHFRRSFAIAQALAAQGCAVRMWCPDENAISLTGSSGLGVNLAVDVNQIPDSDILLVDSYRAPASFTQSRRARSLVCVLDDIADRTLAADVIINPNVYGPRIDYASMSPSFVLAGLKWNPVSVQFAALASRAPERRERILISYGGSDDGSLAIEVAEHLRFQVPSGIDLVASPIHKKNLEVLERTKKLANCAFHYGVDMAALMKEAKLYIGASGSTVWEASAAGLDLVVVGLFDNQRLILNALSDEGFAVATNFDPALIARLAAERLSEHQVNPLTDSLDENGASRLAAELIKIRSGRGRHV